MKNRIFELRRRQNLKKALKCFFSIILVVFGLKFLLSFWFWRAFVYKSHVGQEKKENYNTHIGCEDCALFHYRSDYINENRKQCGWAKTKAQRFCSPKDIGPYLVVAPLWAGLHNNWLHIMSAMFFAQAWGKSGGTVAITGISASRKNFSRETRDQYYPIYTTDLFDIDHTIEYMRKRFNVNICMIKEDMQQDTGVPDQALRVIEQLGSRNGETTELGVDIFNKEGVHADEILQMIPESGEVTLYSNWQWGWGGKYRNSPPGTEDIQDLHITQKRESALSICYSDRIRELSSRSRTYLRKRFTYESILGLHLRLEGDIHPGGLSYDDISRFLKPYERQIEKYKLWSPYNISIYLAHGSLESHVEEKVMKWFHDRKYSFIRKEDTLKGKHLQKLKKMTPDTQAGVDAETLVHLDHFVGYGGSTMSVVILERRRYFGRSATMADIYDIAPIFVPKKSALWA